MNYNCCTLGGRLTADVDLRWTPKGTAVGEFQIAVNRKYKSGVVAAQDRVARGAYALADAMLEARAIKTNINQITEMKSV